MTRRPRAVRNLAVLTGGAVMSRLLGFVAFAHLARVLPARQYGAVEVAVALSLFFGLVVEFGLTPIGAREIAKDARRLTELAGEVPAARLLLSLVAIPLMILIAYPMTEDAGGRLVVWLFAAALFALPWIQRWIFQGLERMAWIAAGDVIRGAVFAVLVLWLVRRSGDLLLVGMAEIAAAVAVCAYFFAAQRRVVPPRFSPHPERLTRLLRETAPMGASQIVWAWNQALPVMLVAALVGTTETAWFGAAQRIALALLVFTRLYHFNLFPTLTRRLHESPSHLADVVRPSMRLTAWGGIGVALGLSLASQPICVAVYGSAFASAAPTLAILVWLFPLTLLSSHAGWSLVAQGDQRFLLVARLAGAAVTLVVGFVLVPLIGAVGAAIAMISAALAIWAVLQKAASRRVTRLPVLFAVLRPAAAAGGILLLLRIANWPSVLEAAIGSGMFALTALLLDSHLRVDLRRIAGVRGGQAVALSWREP
ncbi:MAG: flippase [Gemmatimonadota bacterium]